MHPRDLYQPRDPARPGGRSLIPLIAPLGRASRCHSGAPPRREPLSPRPPRGRTSLGAPARGVGRDLFLLCLSLAFAAAMSGQRAETVGAAQALSEAMAFATAFGAVVTVYGLYRAVEQLRGREREWTGERLCASLAEIGFGLALVAAAQVLRLLSGSGQLPIL